MFCCHLCAICVSTHSESWTRSSDSLTQVIQRVASCHVDAVIQTWFHWRISQCSSPPSYLFSPEFSISSVLLTMYSRPHSNLINIVIFLIIAAGFPESMCIFSPLILPYLWYVPQYFRKGTAHCPLLINKRTLKMPICLLLGNLTAFTGVAATSALYKGKWWDCKLLPSFPFWKQCCG